VFTQYLAKVFLVGPAFHWKYHLLDQNQFFITLSTVLIAAAGYIINDYFDVKIDLINKPDEVIIGRVIKRRWAIIIHQTLNVLGVLIGFAVSIKVLIVNFIAVTCLWFYAERFKRLAFVGNFLVAALTGASLLVMAVYYPGSDLLINIYAVFAFGITLIREVIKDMEDVPGDKKYGCRTLPIIWGIPKTKRFVYFLLAGFILIVLSIGWELNNERVMTIFLLLGIPVIWLIYKLYRADRKSHYSFLSRFCKIIMILGICSMIVI
jgi:4-hydroxybenzoate polyprenyltransferase